MPSNARQVICHGEQAAVTSGGDTRACTTDREAIVLQSADTETQVQNRPPPSRTPRHGGSPSASPACSYARCGGPPGCGLPGSGRDGSEVPADTTADRIAIVE